MMGTNPLSFEVFDVHNPDELNVIIGHAHFIKTVEDVYEAIFQSGTAIKFGLAFCEASEGHPGEPAHFHIHPGYLIPWPAGLGSRCRIYLAARDTQKNTVFQATYKRIDPSSLLQLCLA